MSITQFGAYDFGGARVLRLVCTNTYAEVTAANFVSDAITDFGANFNATDFILVNYGSDSTSQAILRPSISGDDITLAPYAGAKIISGTTGAYGGGGTSNPFAVTGLTSAYKVSAVIRASTNAVAIAKALPGTDILTVTFTADPGAGTTVDFIATSAALS